MDEKKGCECEFYNIRCGDEKAMNWWSNHQWSFKSLFWLNASSLVIIRKELTLFVLYFVYQTWKEKKLNITFHMNSQCFSCNEVPNTLWIHSVITSASLQSLSSVRLSHKSCHDNQGASFMKCIHCIPFNEQQCLKFITFQCTKVRFKRHVTNGKRVEKYSVFLLLKRAVDLTKSCARTLTGFTQVKTNKIDFLTRLCWWIIPHILSLPLERENPLETFKMANLMLYIE